MMHRIRTNQSTWRAEPNDCTLRTLVHWSHLRLLILLLLLVQPNSSKADRSSWSASLRPIGWHSYPRSRSDLTTQAAVARYSSRQDENRLRQADAAYLLQTRTRGEVSNVLKAAGWSDNDLVLCSSSRIVAHAHARTTAFSPTSPASKKPATTARSTTPPSQIQRRAFQTKTALRPLSFWENMFCGAISRSLAQTIMHPANCLKTLLQNANSQSMVDLIQPRQLHRLTRGAGANFLLSVPSGAVNFAVLELVRRKLGSLVDVDGDDPKNSSRKALLGPSLDFLSSCVSTIVCSTVSTPQMVITDNIMAGNYPNLPGAIQGISTYGVAGFYRGWWPGLVGKIPSYALTWTLFQQLKEIRTQLTDRPAKDWENAVMGCLASGTTVSIVSQSHRSVHADYTCPGNWPHHLVSLNCFLLARDR